MKGPNSFCPLTWELMEELIKEKPDRERVRMLARRLDLDDRDQEAMMNEVLKRAGRTKTKRKVLEAT